MANLTEGEIYWSILHSVETENYLIRPAEPSTPWQGKFSISQRSGGVCKYLHRFNNKTGEVDTDSNSTAIVSDRENNVFVTEAEAWQAYVIEMLGYIGYMSRQVDEATVSVSKALDHITHIQKF